MKRSNRQRALYVLAVLFALAPFGFGLLRAVSARSDLRMLWMACAAFVGTAVVVTIGKARWPRSQSVLALSSAALIVAMLCAAVVAMLFGATAWFGIWAVAFVLAFCWAVSYALYARSRSGTA